MSPENKKICFNAAANSLWKVYATCRLKSNGTITNAIKIDYKRAKEGNVSDDVVLKMATDQWIKRYIPEAKPVAEITPALPVQAPVSAVSQAGTLN